MLELRRITTRLSEAYYPVGEQSLAILMHIHPRGCVLPKDLEAVKLLAKIHNIEVIIV